MTRFPQIKVTALGLGILISSLSRPESLATAPQDPAARSVSRPGSAILLQAIRHADWFNWADAGSEFQQAERFFTDQNDSRNALYARIGVLRATMEDRSLTEVQKQLAEIARTPEVQHDPELLLFASIAKADVDGELNAQDSRDDWRRIEQIAKSQSNQIWANRALGEQSFSEFLLGNISKGRVLIPRLWGRAKDT